MTDKPMEDEELMEDELEIDDGVDPQVEMLDLRETDPNFIPPDEDQVEREEGMGNE